MPNLHAAILLGLSLATRAHGGGAWATKGDIEALRDVEGRVVDEIRRMEKMEKHDEAIRKKSDGIRRRDPQGSAAA